MQRFINHDEESLGNLIRIMEPYEQCRIPFTLIFRRSISEEEETSICSPYYFHTIDKGASTTRQALNQLNVSSIPNGTVLVMITRGTSFANAQSRSLGKLTSQYVLFTCYVESVCRDPSKSRFHRASGRGNSKIFSRRSQTRDSSASLRIRLKSCP